MRHPEDGTGFRCYECGNVFPAMWGDTCNACREKERRHQELVAALQGTNAPPSNARPETSPTISDERNGRSGAVGAPQERAGEACIAIIRKYLLHDSQRAVSWHEVQDCIEAIRAAQQAPHTAEEKTR